MTDQENISTDDARSGDETPVVVTAALLVIGDEILSGRTADKNINYLARHCTKIGMQLAEVRVVSDDEDKIVRALDELRSAYDYLFTTGGIGPTHDDITAASVAKAIGAQLEENEEALALMQARYPGKDLTDARRLMARIPVGGALIKNSVSGAPGFMIENVIVMAGVPTIMEVMLDDVTARLRTGIKILARNVVVEHPESSVADHLRELDEGNDGVSIGSYPYFREGRVGTTVVLRGGDVELLDVVTDKLKVILAREGKVFHEDVDGL